MPSARRGGPEADCSPRVYGASEFGSGEIRRRRSDDDGEAAAAVVDGVLGSARCAWLSSGVDCYIENVDGGLLVAIP